MHCAFCCFFQRHLVEALHGAFKGSFPSFATIQSAALRLLMIARKNARSETRARAILRAARTRTLDCPLSKGSQAAHSKFERPNGKNTKSKFWHWSRIGVASSLESSMKHTGHENGKSSSLKCLGKTQYFLKRVYPRPRVFKNGKMKIFHTCQKE